MSKSFGGVPKIAEEARLNKTQIYRILSRRCNPVFTGMNAILHIMSLRLSVCPINAKRKI